MIACDHHARRRAGRAGAGRHQAGARLLDGQPARLHARRRSRSASATPPCFHLLTHAAFKALLFLAAGSVIHAVGTNLMPDMGGLRRLMPVTFATMTIGLAALAGVPPFAGFFSKEAVLGAAEETALHEGPVGVLGRLAGARRRRWSPSRVTAAYATRLWLMTFFGAAARPRSPRTSRRRRCAGRWSLLAVPTVLARPRSGSPSAGCPTWLGRCEPARVCTSSRGADADLLTSVAVRAAGRARGVGAVLAGSGVATPAADPTARARRRTAPLVHAFYVDDALRPGCSSGRCAAPRGPCAGPTTPSSTRRGARLRPRRRRLAGAGARGPSRGNVHGATSPGCSPACCSSSPGWWS